MDLFFAGATRVEDGYPELQEQVSKRLLSYHYQTPSLDDFYFNTERDKYKKIILDSGAFSAWSQGIEIDIVKYADYCLKWQHLIDLIVNLDVIPAKPGIKKIPDHEIERSASQGFKNYQYLLDRGVDPSKLIHVYHQNEKPKWLQKMVDEKLPYIGLSPANDRTVTEKKMWLRDCMPYVTDSEGNAIIKFHGFAVTSFDLMARFPWESVDSSTWAVAGGRGVGMIPHTKNGGTEWDFSREPRKVTLSCIENRKESLKNVVTPNGTDDSDQLKYILKYLDEIGIPLGASAFKVAYKDEVLLDNERVVSKSFVQHMIDDDIESLKIITPGMRWDSLLPKDARWVEVLIEKGAINYWKYRQFMNAYFLNKFVDYINEFHGQYRPNKPNQETGFGL